MHVSFTYLFLTFPLRCISRTVLIIMMMMMMIIILLLLFFIPQVVKIPGVKNYKS